MKQPKNWEYTQLKSVIDDFIVPMRDKPKDLTGSIPWCRIEDFNGKYLTGSKSNQGVSEETVSKMNLKIYPINTVLVSCSANLGKCSIVKKPLMTNQTFIGLVPSNKICEEFLYYIMGFNKVKLNVLSSGTTISYLSRKEFENLKLFIPIKINEQQKIASILSKWDELIETQTQLIEEKEKQKKGLMQKLLTGEVRFPGFEEEWEEKTIAEFGLVQTGNTPSRKELSYWGGDYNWTTADDMDNKYVVSSLQKLTKLGFEKARVAKKGSVLVTCIASIGKNAITKVDTGFNQQINSITVNEEFSSEFIYYLIDSQPNKLLEFAGAGAMPMLNKSNFMKIKYLVPNLKEQSKIALVLSSVDEEIQSLKEKLEAIKLQKKGLMQQLLTGKIRVKI